ncbi:MAG: lysophospholipid acyltransferase family protein [Acidobacteriota bacterium]
MIRSLKALRNGLVVFGVVLGALIVCALPRSAVWRIGRLSGWLGYYLASSARRVARANLLLTFGSTLTEAQRTRIARESLQNLVSTLVMLFWAVRVNRRSFNKYVEVDVQTWSLFREALARGRGVICVTLHYGDWELLGLSMALLGVPLTVAAQQTGINGLDPLLRFCRSRTGNRIVAGRRSLLALAQGIRRGRFPTVLNDLNAKRHGGQWVSFFDLPVYNHPTVGTLAVMTGAPIMYGLAHPLGKGRTRLEWAEIPYSLTGHRDPDTLRINQACMRFAEEVIRRRPECWHWSYPRWKRRPMEERGAYPYYSKFFDSGQGRTGQASPPSVTLVDSAAPLS